jgi:hypothetical protein
MLVFRAWPGLSISAMTALRLTRRCPPGVFHDAILPLSIHCCAVLTATPSNAAAARVVRIGSSSSLGVCICRLQADVVLKPRIIARLQAQSARKLRRMKMTNMTIFIDL